MNNSLFVTDSVLGNFTIHPLNIDRMEDLSKRFVITFEERSPSRPTTPTRPSTPSRPSEPRQMPPPDRQEKGIPRVPPTKR